MAERLTRRAAEEVVEILKPRTDKRRYRRLVLGNSLEVLLISDPHTDKCAASMDVSVGSFSDPDGLEGLAHFLEHMLFYASEKYPLEDSYSKYITEHGGSTNAFTSWEHTNYFFDVNSDCFDEALDRFAQFFIKPLMSSDATLREIKAVDSENQKNILSDAWRMSQLQKHLCEDAHPYHKFSTGKVCTIFFFSKYGFSFVVIVVFLSISTRYFTNSCNWCMSCLLKFFNWAPLHIWHCNVSLGPKCLTLTFVDLGLVKLTHLNGGYVSCPLVIGNWDTLEVKPRAKGLDTHQELIKFYREKYSANLMHLVVYGKEDLDDLQNIVESTFGEIKNTEGNHFKFPGHPCTADHLQILVKTVPIKQGHKLRIIWPITPSIIYYKEAPCTYLGHLIGHEGEGSLFSILKMMGWATSLAAGEGDWTCEFSFFKVVIDLTDAGHDHMSNIVGLLFRYINIIKSSGIQKWIFDELMAICEMKFHYQDKSPPIDYVCNIASDMQLYPPQDWLVQSSVPSKFNPDVIEMVLKDLTPNNVRIFWESKNFEGCTSMIEPWYGTAYSVEKISDDIIQQWILAASDENLHLPKENIFIPTDFELKAVAEKANHPVLLKESFRSRMWYKADTLFFTPKAYLKIDFICPESSYSPEASVLTDIFTRLLMDYLNEYAYDAQVAGLYYGICKTDAGFQVTVVGYNHKMRILLETIMEKIAHFEVKQDRFYVIKEMVEREYENLKFQQPYQQAMYYCSLILEEQAWSWTDQLNVLPSLAVEDLEKFKRRVLSRTFVECYFGGNIKPDEAESLIYYIEDVLFEGSGIMSKPLFPSQYLSKRIIKLEKGMSCFYPVEGLNQRDGNSALVHYIQGGPDEFRFNVKLQLFSLIAKQPAFHQLRSVEQLGYITVLMNRNYSGIRGCQFIIQSTVKDPAQLDMRIEAFLKMFESKLYEMTSDEYKSNVNALIDMKLEKHKNLKEEASFYWREIADGTLKFDRRECEVDVLRELTQLELIDFFDKYIKVGSLHRKSLSIQVFGGLHSSEFKKVKCENDQPLRLHIDDIFSFRRSRPLYGSFKGGSNYSKL